MMVFGIGAQQFALTSRSPGRHIGCGAGSATRQTEGLGVPPATRRQAARAARDAMECGGALCAVSSACLPAGNRWLRKWVEPGLDFLSPGSRHVPKTGNTLPNRRRNEIGKLAQSEQ